MANGLNNSIKNGGSSPLGFVSAAINVVKRQTQQQAQAVHSLKTGLSLLTDKNVFTNPAQRKAAQRVKDYRVNKRKQLETQINKHDVKRARPCASEIIETDIQKKSSVLQNESNENIVTVDKQKTNEKNELVKFDFDALLQNIEVDEMDDDSFSDDDDQDMFQDDASNIQEKSADKLKLENEKAEKEAEKKAYDQAYGKILDLSEHSDDIKDIIDKDGDIDVKYQISGGANGGVYPVGASQLLKVILVRDHKGPHLSRVVSVQNEYDIQFKLNDSGISPHVYYLSKVNYNGYDTLLLKMDKVPSEDVEDTKNLVFKQNEKDRKVIVADFVSKVFQMHEKGVVHRDIKPGNLILDSTDNRIKIIDFGTALLRDVCHEAVTFGIEGTPPYMGFVGEEDKVGHTVSEAKQGDLTATLLTAYEFLTGDSIAKTVYTDCNIFSCGHVRTQIATKKEKQDEVLSTMQENLTKAVEDKTYVDGLMTLLTSLFKRELTADAMKMHFLRV